jgi:hypothetical protein
MATRLEKPHTLTDVLSQGKLKTLQDQLDYQQQLNNLVNACLDAPLRHQVRVSHYQGGVLTLSTHSSSLASQLRYLNRIYLQRLHLHDEFCDLTRIQISHIPMAGADLTPTTRLKTPPRRLSLQSAKYLQALAEDMGEGEVSEALYRLASHAVQPT